MGLEHQLGFLLLYQPSCYVAASLPVMLDAMSGSVVEFFRFMELVEFNLPSLGENLEAVVESIATIETIDLSQLFEGPPHWGWEQGHILDLVFVSWGWL